MVLLGAGEETNKAVTGVDKKIVEEAQAKWNDELKKLFETKNEEYTFTKMSFLGGTGLDDVVEELGEANWPLIAGSYALMISYIALTFFKKKRLELVHFHRCVYICGFVIQ